MVIKNVGLIEAVYMLNSDENPGTIFRGKTPFIFTS